MRTRTTIWLTALSCATVLAGMIAASGGGAVPGRDYGSAEIVQLGYGPGGQPASGAS